MALQEVKTAIDNYLAAGVGNLILPIDQIIELYVDNVGGFKELKEKAEKIAEEHGDVVTKEEVNEMIAEERKKAVEELKKEGGQVKKEFENKVNELKAGVAEIKNVAVELGKELGKSIADAVVPTSLGPVAPNPISSAIRLYINVSRIKRTVDGVLMVTSKTLGMITELGLDETPLASSITAIAQPLVSIKEQAGSKGSKADAVGEDPNPAAGYEIMKKDYVIDNPGNSAWPKIDGIKIEQETKSKFGDSFPLNGGSKLKFNNIINKGNHSQQDKNWATAILKYNDWHVQNIK